MQRRDFLKTAAHLSAGAAAALAVPGTAEAGASLKNLKYRLTVPELYRPIPRPPAHSRAIVIGSGFGGAITALRLANAGVQTTVLERGSLWPNDPWRAIFASEALPDGRGYWHRTKVRAVNGLTYPIDYFNGVFDIQEYGNIDVWCAACVGGGSVVFTGVMIEPERAYFDAIYRGLVSWDEMHNVYYPRVRRMLRLSPMPDDVYNAGPFGHSRVWDQQARKAGHTLTRPDSIFNWDIVRKELRLASRGSAIVGDSDLGNSNGAKFDLNQNYLKQATSTGQAKVYPGHEVARIHYDGSRYFLDTIKYAPDGTVIDRYSLSCDYLFLAAGSMGSSRLMVSARDRGDLPKLNEHVGLGWGTNGDARVARSFSPIKGLLQGAPCASMLHVKSHIPTTFENWYTPSVPINVGIIGTLGMGFDLVNRGRFVYDNASQSARLQWPANGNDEVVAVAREMNNWICANSGVVPGAGPFAKDVDGSFTAHPLGGLVLGQATDAHGRLDGYRRLYAMDGSVIPGTTGAVNPSLTISALAERNIEHILRNDF